MSEAEHDVDDAMLQAMRAAAVYQARRVARTLKLALQDREDVEQDILLVLLERRRFFDPTRGPWVPFRTPDRPPGGTVGRRPPGCGTKARVGVA